MPITSKKQALEVEKKVKDALLKSASSLFMRTGIVADKIQKYLDIPVQIQLNKLKGKSKKLKTDKLLKEIEEGLNAWMQLSYKASQKVLEDIFLKELTEAEMLKKVKIFFSKELKRIMKFLKVTFKDKARRVLKMLKGERERESSDSIIQKKLGNLNAKNRDIAHSTSRNAIVYGFNKGVQEEVENNQLIHGVRWTSQLEMNTCIRCGMLDGTFYWKFPLV